ncbi:MAG: endo alpha-1,4 polygalactosaminidase [Bacteroidota bacterium]|nr:endo alpha-1,4 polygalactosaminidase [Bacteroidota bacterium]
MKTIWSLLFIVLLISCNPDCDLCTPENFREEMRILVSEISEFAKDQNSTFVIIPQNGIELITEDGLPDGELSTGYLEAIDGHGQEDLFFGYNSDNQATPEETSAYLNEFLNRSSEQGKPILVTDYCSDKEKVDAAHSVCVNSSFISFAANERDLSNIPPYPATPYEVNDNNINDLTSVRNFLYILNQKVFTEHSDFIQAVSATDYDLLIMDLYGENGISYTSEEINQLKQKVNGGTRLLICYLSIGEAEDYRYYWQSDWSKNSPDWLGKENPKWDGNYKVRYWHDEWKEIILGQENSYLSKILSAGFDGVYLDIIDAFEYWE